MSRSIRLLLLFALIGGAVSRDVCGPLQRIKVMREFSECARLRIASYGHVLASYGGVAPFIT